VFETANRNMPARNTLVQLLTPCTDYESHNALNAQRHRQTDRQTDGLTLTDDRIMLIADHTV